MSEVTARDIHNWELITSDAFVPLKCSAQNSDFRAELSTTELSQQISLAHIRSGQVRVDRTDSLARKSEHNDILMSLQLRSHSFVHQHDRTARLDPGSAVLYEANRPYTLDHRTDDQELLVIKFPRNELGLTDNIISQLCGRDIDRSTAGMSALAGYFLGIASELTELPATVKEDLGCLTLEMLMMVIRSFGEQMPTSMVSNYPMFETLKTYIKANFKDPQLTVEHIASAHHISVRKVHDLFSEHQETPGHYLRRMRLNFAAGLLSRGMNNHQTIAAIARSAGFPNASTFARTFKKMYGATPTEWRTVGRN